MFKPYVLGWMLMATGPTQQVDLNSCLFFFSDLESLGSVSVMNRSGILENNLLNIK